MRIISRFVSSMVCILLIAKYTIRSSSLKSSVTHILAILPLTYQQKLIISVLILLVSFILPLQNYCRNFLFCLKPIYKRSKLFSRYSFSLITTIFSSPSNNELANHVSYQAFSITSKILADELLGFRYDSHPPCISQPSTR